MANVEWPEIKDRNVATPSRVKLTTPVGIIGEPIYDIEPIPGTIVEEGTPVNKQLFDKVKDYIDDHAGSGNVPIATVEVPGIVKPDGTTITITEDGTITSVGGGEEVTAIPSTVECGFSAARTITNTTTNQTLVLSRTGQNTDTSKFTVGTYITVQQTGWYQVNGCAWVDSSVAGGNTPIVGVVNADNPSQEFTMGSAWIPATTSTLSYTIDFSPKIHYLPAGTKLTIGGRASLGPITIQPWTTFIQLEWVETPDTINVSGFLKNHSTVLYNVDDTSLMTLQPGTYVIANNALNSPVREYGNLLISSFEGVGEGSRTIGLAVFDNGITYAIGKFIGGLIWVQIGGQENLSITDQASNVNILTNSVNKKGKQVFVQYSFSLSTDLTPGKWSVGKCSAIPSVTPTFPIGVKGFTQSVSGYMDLDGTIYVENDVTIPANKEIRLNFWYPIA